MGIKLTPGAAIGGDAKQ